MAHDRAKLKPRTLILTCALLTLLVYLPGISGGFVFDDYNNILLNKDLQNPNFNLENLLQAGWSGMAGPLKRPLAMMSFAFNYATTGQFITAFKLTNLIIHIVNGMLVFVFLRQILLSQGDRNRTAESQHMMLAAVAASIWLLHPLNLTSVLYVVQRMNSLSAMFSLIALISYCAGRQKLEMGQKNGWWMIAVACPALIALGVLCKENAVLTAPLIALIEVTLFRFRTCTVHDKRLLISIFSVAFVIPLFCVAYYLLTHPNYISGGYASRPFTLDERLLTEARVLWFYLSLLLIPRLNQFGLYHDDFPISAALFEPFTTAIAVAGIVIAVLVAILGRRRWPILTFAIGWYLIGHVMESSLIALELVHEHRNYVPSIGVLFALCFGAARLFASGSHQRLSQIAAGLAVVLCASMTFLRAGDWSDPATLAVVEAQRHPNSERAVYDLGRIQFGLYELTEREEFYDQGIANLEHAVELDPNIKQPLIGVMRMAYEFDHALKPEWMPEALRRYEHTLFHPSETDDLNRLVQCRAKENCTFPAQDVFQLYFAALRNPSLPEFSKAQLMVDLAAFYVNESYELEPAMNLLDDAVTAFPTEFNFRKVRAQIYLMAERYNEVAEETRFMRSVPRWSDVINSPVGEISAIEQALAETMNREVRENP